MGAELSIQDDCIQKIIALPTKNYKSWNEIIGTWNSLVPICTEDIPEGIALPLCHDKRVWETIRHLLGEQLRAKVASVSRDNNLTELLCATIRLLCLKGLFKIFPCIGYNELVAIINCYMEDQLDDSVLKAALQAVKVSIERVSYKSDKKYDQYEIVNKKLFYTEKGFQTLAKLFDKLSHHQASHSDSKADLLSWILRIFDSAFIVRKHTTEFDIWKVIVSLLHQRIKLLFDSSRHNFPSVRKYASRLIKHLILNSTPDEVMKLQDIARSYGALLWHYALSLEYKSGGGGSASNRPDELVMLSRMLVALFCFKNPANRAVIQHSLPPFIFTQLSSGQGSEAAVKFLCDSLDLGIIINNKDEKRAASTVLLATCMVDASYIAKNENWSHFFSSIDGDHANPICIWNTFTRNELRETILSDIYDLDYLRSVDGSVQWDPEGFTPSYESISTETVVDGFFLRLLIPEIENLSHDVVHFVDDPQSLFRSIYNKAVVEDDNDVKFLYVYTMRSLVCRYEDLKENFEALDFVFWLLKHNISVQLWRDQIILMLNELFQSPDNVKKIIKNGGLRILLPFLTILVKEDLAAEKMDTYDNTGSTMTSPRSEMMLHSKHFVGNMKSILPLSNQQLISLILHTLNEGITAVPRLKNALCSGDNLGCLIRALMYPDMQIVIGTIQLLCEVVASTPKVFSKIHNTGIFAFLLATANSERGLVMPAVEFLNTFHLLQDEVEEGRPKMGSVITPGGRRPTAAVATVIKLKERVGTNSYLRHFLPLRLVELLLQEGCESFCRVMNAEKIAKPDLIWGRDLRCDMVVHINAQMETFRKAFMEDSGSYFEFFEPEQIVYPVYTTTLSVGNVFLDFFIEGAEFQTPCKYDKLFLALVDELASTATHTKLFQDSLVLEKATKILVSLNIILDLDDHPTIVPKFFDPLLLLLGKYINDPSCHMVLQKCMELLLKSMLGKGKVESILKCSSEGLLDSMSSLFGIPVHSALKRESYSLFLTGLNTLCIMSSVEEGRVKILERPTIIQHLTRICNVTSFKTLAANASLFKEAARCMELLSLTLDNHFIASGVVLISLQTIISPTEVNSQQFGEAWAGLKLLTQCIGNLKHELIDKCLDQLLTSGLKFLLRNDIELFLQTIRSKTTVQTAAVMWTQEMTKKLDATLSAQLVLMEKSRDGIWDIKMFIAADSYLYTYPELENELIVSHIFIKSYIAKPVNLPTVSFVSMMHFALEILSRVQKVRLILRYQNSPSVSDITEAEQAILGTLLQALQSCLTVDPSLIPELLDRHITSVLDLAVKSDLAMVHRVAVFKFLLYLSGASKIVYFMPRPLHKLFIEMIKGPFNAEEQTLILQVLYNTAKNSDEGAMILAASAFPFYYVFVTINKIFPADFRHLAAKSMSLLLDEWRECNVKTASWMKALCFPLFSSSTTYQHMLQASINKAPTAIYDHLNIIEDSLWLKWNDDVRGDMVNYLQAEIDKFAERTPEDIESLVKIQIPYVKGSGVTFLYEFSPAFSSPSLKMHYYLESIYLPYFVKHPEAVKEVNVVALMESINTKLAGLPEDLSCLLDTVDESSSIGDDDLSSQANVWWQTVQAVIQSVKYGDVSVASCQVTAKYAFLHIKETSPDTIKMAALPVIGSLVRRNGVMNYIYSVPPSILSCQGIVLDLLRLLKMNWKQESLHTSAIIVLKVIGILASDAVSNFAVHFRNAGGIIYLLHILATCSPTNQMTVHAASCINVLCCHDEAGATSRRFICRWLTEEFQSRLTITSEVLLSFWMKDHSCVADGRKWNKNTREQLVVKLNEALDLLESLSDDASWDGTTRRWAEDRVETVSSDGARRESVDVKDFLDTPLELHSLDSAPDSCPPEPPSERVAASPPKGSSTPPRSTTPVQVTPVTSPPGSPVVPNSGEI